MSSTATTHPAFSGDEVARLIELIRDSDSVELKLMVPEPQHRSTAVALGMDPLQAQIREAFFFDTADLALNRNGIVVRARRIQGKRGDSVVKLRPVVPAELSREQRAPAGFRVEVDVLPDGFVCSATLKRRFDPDDVRSAAAGELAVRKLFSKQQRDFFGAHSPDGLGLDDLLALGPIFILKLAFEPAELKRRMVAEMWLYPDGSRILELSTRCATGEAFQAAAETVAYLASRGVDLTGEQETKTHRALQYFASAQEEA
jgi:hypothetical protein